jgi:hypothetical protein
MSIGVSGDIAGIRLSEVLYKHVLRDEGETA